MTALGLTHARITSPGQKLNILSTPNLTYTLGHSRLGSGRRAPPVVQTACATVRMKLPAETLTIRFGVLRMFNFCPGEVILAWNTYNIRFSQFNLNIGILGGTPVFLRGVSLPCVYHSGSFESMAPTLAKTHWSLHGGAPPDNCSAGEPFGHTCTRGNNVMSERNYPCDDLIWTYFGDASLAALDEVGEALGPRFCTKNTITSRARLPYLVAHTS